MKTAQVGLIVDSIPLADIYQIAAEMPVWLLESVLSSQALDDLRKKSAYTVTTFSGQRGETGADIVSRILDELDEHHNDISQDPPYRSLHVFGVDLTEVHADSFRDLGFIRFEPRVRGFVAYKESK